MSNNDGRANRRHLSEQSASSQVHFHEGRAPPAQRTDQNQYAFSSALNRPVSRTSSIRSRIGPQNSMDIADERSMYDTPFEDTEYEDHIHEEPRRVVVGNTANTMLARQSTEENRLATVQAWRAQNGEMSHDELGNPPDEERARMAALSRIHLANQRMRDEKRASDQTLTDYRSQLQNQDHSYDLDKGASQVSSPQPNPEPRRPRAKSMDSFTYGKLTGGASRQNPISRADHYNGLGGRDLEREGSRANYGNDNRRGILGQLKDSLKSIARDQDFGSVPNSRALSRDPSQYISRRNSWSGSQGPRTATRESQPDPLEGMNIFERSQALNDDVEETYLIDENDHEGFRHRLRRHHTEHQMDKTLHGDERRAQAAARKSYNDRRKREKHKIEFHQECTC